MTKCDKCKSQISDTEELVKRLNGEWWCIHCLLACVESHEKVIAKIEVIAQQIISGGFNAPPLLTLDPKSGDVGLCTECPACYGRPGEHTCDKKPPKHEESSYSKCPTCHQLSWADGECADPLCDSRNIKKT